MYRVERYIESQAAMHALATEYVANSLQRGEPAILVSAEIAGSDGREIGSVVVLAEDRHERWRRFTAATAGVLPWRVQRHAFGLARFVGRAAECS